MIVEVLRCQKHNDLIWGEYYIEGNGKKWLVLQNGNDIQMVVHWLNRPIKECLEKPTQEVIDAIIMASVEYLKK